MVAGRSTPTAPVVASGTCPSPVGPSPGGTHAHPHPGPVRRPRGIHADHRAGHGADTTTPDPAPVTAPAPAPVSSATAATPPSRPFRPRSRAIPRSSPERMTGSPARALRLARGQGMAGPTDRTTSRRPSDGKPQVVEVRGRITSSRPISNVRTVRLEDKQRGEWVSVQRPKRKVMDFRFVNGGYIDGIDFNAGCAGKLTFTAWQVVRDATTKKVVGTHTARGARRGDPPGCHRHGRHRQPEAGDGPRGHVACGGPAHAGHGRSLTDPSTRGRGRPVRVRSDHGSSASGPPHRRWSIATHDPYTVGTPEVRNCRCPRTAAP